MEPIELDVLVIGGGAQGLWVLRDLDKRGYRTVLLERHELGGGQTCHSHALIHRGHYYDDIDMMVILNAAAQFWRAFIDSAGIKKLNRDRALAGFGPGTRMEEFKFFWKTAGLEFNQLSRDEFPPLLRDGKVRFLFETEEFSLDANIVVREMAGEVDHCIYKIADQDDAIDFDLRDGRIEAVAVKMQDASITFRPHFVVLAAGVGNINLLQRMGAERNPHLPEVLVQAERKNHMLVVRAPNLPPLTAVFPIRGGLQGVFICARPGHNGADTAWLVSDHNSTPFSASVDQSGKFDPRPSAEWIHRILISLDATAPGLFKGDLGDELALSVYTGLTSERDFGVGDHKTDCFIDPLDFKNALVVWPTKLTLTPFASNVALRFIRPQLAEPSGGWPRIGRPLVAGPPGFAPEFWRRDAFEGATEARTEWLSYEDFVAEWGLTGVVT